LYEGKHWRQNYLELTYLVIDQVRWSRIGDQVILCSENKTDNKSGCQIIQKKKDVIFIYVTELIVLSYVVIEQQF
jgi:hypothetical protein